MNLNILKQLGQEKIGKNTFCVNFVNQILKDKLNYDFERSDDSIIFSIDVPILKQIQQQSRNNKPRKPLENFKPSPKPRPIKKHPGGVNDVSGKI